MNDLLPGAGVPLATLADRPDVDPCDVACDALPARLLGELTDDDERWLASHTADCRYCSRQLDGFEQLEAAIDACCPEVAGPPPAVSLPLGSRPGVWFEQIESPIGPLLIGATARGLCEVTFDGFRSEEDVRDLLGARGLDVRPSGEDMPADARAVLDEAGRQLGEYFAGVRQEFDLPLDFRGVTPFTRSVLEATAGVPFGRLESYRGIAIRVGKPGASRAVGNALGRNPLPVIVPCHRIVASGGGIGGYTGGLAIKERLLAIEGAMLG
jgi:methylated-DNA-[protein]-cysteine S-methyltransferase